MILGYLGFLGGLAGKESTCNMGDPSSIPGSGRSAGEGIGYPLQYSGLKNSRGHKVADTTERLSLSQWDKGNAVRTFYDPMDCTVHGILQARILEWVAFPFSRASAQPRD